MLRGYSKKNRKLRRKRRSTKRFGSPPAEHGARAVKSAKDTRLLLKRVRQDLSRARLERVDCANAFAHLIGAARSNGISAAEGMHTGLIRQTRRRTWLRGFGGDKPLSAAIRRFHAKCMIDPR